MDKNSIKYILALLDYDNSKVMEIEEQNAQRDDVQPNIGKITAKLLGLLIRLTGAKRVLEFGTSNGYSAICIGEALRHTNGHLITVEYHQRLCQEARANIEQAGLNNFVEVVHGNSAEVIDHLEGPFDLIFQDSMKTLYPQLLEKCLRLLRINGLLLADDTLFKPLGKRDSLSDPTHEYNKLVCADKRLYTSILPIGDGLTLSVKLSD